MRSKVIKQSNSGTTIARAMAKPDIIVAQMIGLVFTDGFEDGGDGNEVMLGGVPTQLTYNPLLHP